MKKINLMLTSLAVMSLIVSGCESNEQKPTVKKPVRLDIVNYSSIEELKDEIKVVSQTLATTREWITNDGVMNSVEAGISVPEFTGANVMLDSVEYEIQIEFFNENQALEFASNFEEAEYQVMIDPDFFFSNDSEEEGFDVPLFDNEGNETSIYLPNITSGSEDTTTVDNVKNSVETPTFLVTLQEVVSAAREQAIWDEVFGDTTFTKPNTLPYLVVKEIRLKTEKDGWTKEEFELYFNAYYVIDNLFPTVDYIYSITPHRFNGNNHIDAAGNSKYYADVNKKNKTYVMPQDIAIYPLDYEGIPLSICSIEDDHNAYKHESNNYTPSVPFKIATIQTFHVLDWTVNSVSTIFKISGNDGWPDNDDIYEKSGVDQMTISSVNLVTDGQGYFRTKLISNGDYSLEHVNYKLGKKSY